MKGWVYIITNKSMPDLLKVGFSTKDPELRAAELHTTGVPHRFVVEYDALVNEPFEVEQKAHALLRAYHENKEWFRCDIATAIIAIRQAANGSIILETNKKEILLEIERIKEKLEQENKKCEAEKQANLAYLIQKKQKLEAESIAKNKLIEEERNRQESIKRIDEETREVLEKSPVGAGAVILALVALIIVSLGAVNQSEITNQEFPFLTVLSIPAIILSGYAWARAGDKKTATEKRKQFGLPPIK